MTQPMSSRQIGTWHCSEAFTAKGIEVLATEPFESGDTDFSAQLTRIQALEPDAIFVSALPPEKPGILIQADALGISAPFIVSSLTGVEVACRGCRRGRCNHFYRLASYRRYPWKPGVSFRIIVRLHGMEPNALRCSSSYAAVHILAEAIRNAASTDSVSLRDALANIVDFDTVLGKFSFNADGDAVYDQKTLVVKDGDIAAF